MGGLGRVLGRRWGTLAAILGIGMYTVLAGASFSVLRAALMGSLAQVARQFGRQTGVNTLAISAAVLAAFNPNALWDAGFQLSFGATLGLVLYADALQGGFTSLLKLRLPLDKARRIAGPVGEYFLFTLAAQVMTLPIIARLHRLAHRPEWVDRADYGWGADVGGGGEEVMEFRGRF